MRDIPIFVLLILSLVVACGGEKAVHQPAADEGQAAATEPAGSLTPAATTEAPSAEEVVTSSDEAGVETGASAAAVPAQATPSGTKSESETPPVQPAQGKTAETKAEEQHAAAPVTVAPDVQKEAPAEETTPALASLVEEGRAIFGRRCATCHAKDGSGDTAMGRRQGIPNFASDEVQGLSDEELQRLIREGAGAVSRQAHQNKLQNDHEIRAVVAWIRSLG